MDLDTVEAIELACFQSELLSRRQLRYLLSKANACTLLYQCEGQVVAYAMALYPGRYKPARIYSLAVLSAFRGKKIASQLLDALRQRIIKRGYGEIRLEVRVSQADVQALYRRMGYEFMEFVPRYYGDGEDACRMRLWLTPAQAVADNINKHHSKHEQQTHTEPLQHTRRHS
jgi:ribosomal protein S18 acetylase RimI-like enzyme